MDIQKKVKELIKQKSEVFTVDIQIKQWVLRVFNSKVFNTEHTFIMILLNQEYL